MTWPVQDAFTRADADALGAMSDGVHNWTEALGDMDISGNKAILGNDVNRHIAVVTETHTETDYYVQSWVDPNYNNATPGVCGRETGTGDFYGLRRYGYNMQMFKVVTGSLTQLGANYSIGSSAAGTIKLEMNGTTIKGYWNGTEQISVTDSAHSSGKPGLWHERVGLPQAGIAWDDFIADVLVVAGQPIRKRMGGIPGMQGDRGGGWRF